MTTTRKKRTVIARANIALVKYWGKRDGALRLPLTDSLGITLDGLQTRTTAELDSSLADDWVSLDGVELAPSDKKRQRIVGHLERMRRLTGRDEKLRIATVNGFPTGAGLASSASGLMALTFAVAAASGTVDPLRVSDEEWRELSLWARLGSGSACRCAFGGFVQWLRGDSPDGRDSYAIPVAGRDWWPELRLLVAIVDAGEKSVSSTVGMDRSRDTSPLMAFWPTAVKTDLQEAREAIEERDFERLGRVTERNAMLMHATTFTADPPYGYWLPQSLELLQRLWALRRDGWPVYVTMDAGPQVKVLCLESDVARLRDALASCAGLRELREFRVGDGPNASEEHLF